MTVSRRCAHPECVTRITDGKLACRDHWNLLPINLRNRIWKHHHYGNTRAHAIAVREAIAHWTPQPVAPRCYSCRTREPDFVDETVGKPICLGCAKIGTGAKSTPRTCDSCGRQTEILVGVETDEPDVCLDCAIRLVAV